MPRLRQVALVARELEPVVAQLQSSLRLGVPYRDPQVALFGLRNAVFTVGDCFLEVVSPLAPGTAAGRYLERRGGDAGYMAIFQVGDVAAARERVTSLGVRVVWQVDLDEISGTHLHPRDVPGAIVSLDEARPPESWHWAGPGWVAGEGGITSITVAVVDPEAAARRWAAVLGVDDTAAVGVRFVPAAGPAAEGIEEVGLALPGRRGRFEAAGVRFAPTANETGPP